MSYDFDLFEMKTGMDLDAALERREQRVLAGQVGHDNHALNLSLAEALIRQNPHLNMIEVSSHIELDAGAEGNGIQIMLFDVEASITVPYWHPLPLSRKVFEEIWGYLRTIQQKTNYVVYDPQIGRLLDLNADFEEVVVIYSMMVGKIGNATS